MDTNASTVSKYFKPYTCSKAPVSERMISRYDHPYALHDIDAPIMCPVNSHFYNGMSHTDVMMKNTGENFGRRLQTRVLLGYTFFKQDVIMNLCRGISMVR